jgi:hypothetical protein
MLEQARDRVAGQLATSQGTQVSAFAPELLALIGEVILMVLENCLQKSSQAEVESRMRSPGFLERLIDRRQVRQQLFELHGPGAWRQFDGAGISEALVAAAQSASKEERLAILQEVRSQAFPLAN